MRRRRMKSRIRKDARRWGCCLIGAEDFLSDRSSAIQSDNLSRDVSAFGREEMNELRDVLRRSRSSQRDALEVLFLFGFRIIPRPFDDAGGDAVDADVW